MALNDLWRFVTDEDERKRRVGEFRDQVDNLVRKPPAIPSIGQIGHGLAEAGRFYYNEVAQPWEELVLRGLDPRPRFMKPKRPDDENIFLNPEGPRAALHKTFTQRPQAVQTAADLVLDPANLLGAIKGVPLAAKLGTNLTLGATGGAALGESLGGETGSVLGTGVGLGLGALGVRGQLPTKGPAMGIVAGGGGRGAGGAIPPAGGQSVTQTGGNAAVDLLGLEGRQQMETSRRVGDVLRVGQQAMVGKRGTVVTVPVRAYETVRDRVIPSQVSRIRDEFRTAIKGVFRFDGEGRVTNVDGSPSFGDIAEAPGQFALTTQQQSALARVKSILQPLEDNDAFYGVKHPLIQISDPNGFYFPRIALGKNGELRPMPPRLGAAGGLGSKASSSKPRYFDTMADGTKAGVNYALPWNAVELHARGALKEAADEWVLGKVLPHTNTTNGLMDASVFGSPKLLGRYFDDPEIAAEVQQVMDPNNSLAFIRNISRPLVLIRATADLSAAGTIGLSSVATNPVGFGKAFVQSVKAAFNSPIGSEAANIARQQRQGLTPLTRAEKVRLGLVYASEQAGGTEFNPAIIRKPGQSLATSATNKAANIIETATAPFDRAFGRFRTVLAEENFDQARLLAKATGQNPNDEQLLRKLARDANLFSGIASTNPSNLEKALEFAPGYFRSQLEIIGRLVGKNGVDTNLLRARVGFMVTGAMVSTALINEARGKETDWNPVRKIGGDYRWNPNFMRIRDVNGVDISLLGPWDSLTRLLVTVGTGTANRDVGEVLSALRPKLGPAPQMLYDLISNKDFMGRPIRNTSGQLGVYAAQQVTPFGVAGVIRESQGGQPPETVATSGVLGILGGKGTPMSPSDHLDTIAQNRYKRPYRDLERWEQKEIERSHPQVYQSLIANSRPETQQAEATRQKLYQEQVESDARFQSGEITYRQWKEDLGRRRDQQRAILGYIYRDQVAQKDSPMTRYFDVINGATRPDGTVNWDVVDGAITSMSPEDQAYIQRNTNLDGTPLVKQYNDLKRQAAPLAKEFFDMPAYRGLTVEEGQQVTQLMQEVRSLMDQRRQGSITQDQAIRMVARGRNIPPKVMRAALDPDRYRNQARSRFWRSHPILEQVLGDLDPFRESQAA